MKKLLCCMAATVFALSVQAQVYVGGTLGLSVEKTTADQESHTNSAYSIAPEIGYNFNRVWAVGASAGVLYTVSGGGGNDVTTIDVSPYVRATFARVKNVAFFTEAAFSYERAKVSDWGAINGWGVALRPGLSVGLSRRVQLIGRTSLIQYAVAGKHPYKVKQTGWSLNNRPEIGIIVSI